MKIWYRDDGTIFKVTDDEAEGEGSAVLIENKKAPADLIENFAHGKYSIKKKKISIRKGFKALALDDLADHPLKEVMQALEEAPHPKKGVKKKKTEKSAGKKREK